MRLDEDRERFRKSLLALARGDVQLAESLLREAASESEMDPPPPSSSSEREAWFWGALARLAPAAPNAMAAMAHLESEHKHWQQTQSLLPLLLCIVLLEAGDDSGALAALSQALENLCWYPWTDVTLATSLFRAAAAWSENDKEREFFVCLAACSTFLGQEEYATAREWLRKVPRLPETAKVLNEFERTLDIAEGRV